jgi:hypothetical protein
MLARSSDSSGRFNQIFLESLADQWPSVTQQWQLFVTQMDYGYDVAREAIDPRPLQSLPAAGGNFVLQANRGWQSTGYTITAGSTLRISGEGQFQLANDPQPWISEAGGLTIEYYRGKPLGLLLAAVSEPGEAGLTRLADPQPIGLVGRLECSRPGILYVRVNDAPSQLADNQGQLQVSIQVDPDN